MRKLVYSILALIIFSSSVFAQAKDAKSIAILKKVSAKVESYSNMKFDFQYIISDKKNKVNDTLKGDIVMKGDQYFLNFMERKIVSDGKTVWTIDPDAEELQISNVKKGEDAFNPGSILTGYDKSYRSKLIKTITISGKSYYIIDLYPKKGKAFYKIRLTIAVKELRVVKGKIFNKDNVTYTYVVQKFIPNLKLDPNFFKVNLKDYEDMDVVDLR